MHFYSENALSQIKLGSHLLTLILEPVIAAVTVRHASNILCKITKKVYSGQIFFIPYHWHSMMELQKLLLLFLQSLRQSSCYSYFLGQQTLLEFGISVLVDIKSLPQSIKQEFNQEFTVKKSKSVFSVMEIDQAHEQNNKAIKADGEATGIMDNESALLAQVGTIWSICR